jgi:hypothetical protein
MNDIYQKQVINMCCDPFDLEELEEIEADLRALRAAMRDYSGDGIVSYTFNTSQTIQTVTKSSLKDLQQYRDSLMARRKTLRQLCGLDKASFNAAPGW